ncbi:Lmo0779 family protein [Listeria costaricensis]|uniref:Lmo0779 family protein n=1 Tax=Listeria costaricensis TaxID=2026604 RepID=UPI000C07A8F9|nr:Lmo0779 family protein [Listeria costaricensis]
MDFNATNIFLIILNIAALAFILYDGVVLSLWKGKTVLKVNLRTRGRWDGYIFVGLIVLLFASNIMRGGDLSTTILLGIMGLLFVYICFMRSSKAIFKKTGLFYALLFFPYANIERMNLSEDGVLVIETGRQRLMLFVKSADDLEKMLQVFAEYS